MGQGLVNILTYAIKFVAQALGLLHKSEMEPSLEKVVTAIVSHVRSNGSYVTKTKLLKLLYLFDVEYYRIHRKTFTGFEWIYYLLGPWAEQYDPLLSSLVERGILNDFPGSNPDNEAHFYSASEKVDLFKLFPDYQDEKTLRLVLNAWGDKTSAQILDYVYFSTEPMIHGARNAPLDFSLIPAEKPNLYNRQSSGKSPEEIKAFRREFERQRDELLAGKAKTTPTPPRYDDVYFEAMAKIDSLED